MPGPAAYESPRATYALGLASVVGTAAACDRGVVTAVEGRAPARTATTVATRLQIPRRVLRRMADNFLPPPSLCWTAPQNVCGSGDVNAAPRWDSLATQLGPDPVGGACAGHRTR